MKKSGSVIKTVIVVIIMIGLIVGFYFAVSLRNGKDGSKEEAQVKSGNTLLRRDLEKDYPPTPTAVASYYNDLVLAYYKEDCKDSLREKLVSQSRLLYDEELLKNNSLEEQMEKLEADVKDYKKNKRKIIKYTICKPDEVEYGDLEGAEVALMKVSYRVRDKKDLKDVDEEFFLRKDDEGRWKIVGWQLAWKNKNSGKGVSKDGI